MHDEIIGRKLTITRRLETVTQITGFRVKEESEEKERSDQIWIPAYAGMTVGVVWMVKAANAGMDNDCEKGVRKNLDRISRN